MKGLSLLEIVLVSAIALVIGTYLLSIMVSSNGFFLKQGAVINEGVGLNDSMPEITSLIRQSAYVSVGYPESSPIYQTGLHSLVLKLPSIDESEVIPNVYDYAVISADSSNQNVLRLRVYPDSQSQRDNVDQVLTTFLDSINFSYLDKNNNTVTPVNAKVVNVSLTIESKTGQVSSKRTSEMAVSLRNI